MPLHLSVNKLTTEPLLFRAAGQECRRFTAPHLPALRGTLLFTLNAVCKDRVVCSITGRTPGHTTTAVACVYRLRKQPYTPSSVAPAFCSIRRIPALFTAELSMVIAGRCSMPWIEQACHLRLQPAYRAAPAEAPFQPRSLHRPAGVDESRKRPFGHREG